MKTFSQLTETWSTEVLVSTLKSYKKQLKSYRGGERKLPFYQTLKSRVQVLESKLQTK
tara:strand:+ start:890 stop:1063 length:174 start_codon:yes stop_codon:yes gene_type:complete